MRRAATRGTFGRDGLDQQLKVASLALETGAEPVGHDGRDGFMAMPGLSASVTDNCPLGGRIADAPLHRWGIEVKASGVPHDDGELHLWLVGIVGLGPPRISRRGRGDHRY